MFATSSALNARFNATQTHARAHRRRSSSRVEAFWKKAPPPPPPPPPPPKKPAFFALRKPQPPAREEPVYEYEETKGEAYARIRKQRAKRKAEFEARERGGFASALWKVTSALDFQEDIVADRGLLASAKNMRKGEKMDRAQYGALKRKVGGSKSGFFGESVDVKVRSRSDVRRARAISISSSSRSRRDLNRSRATSSHRLSSNRGNTPILGTSTKRRTSASRPLRRRRFSSSSSSPSWPPPPGSHRKSRSARHS